ncbi:MAG: hypothetical protein LC118_19655, partial [Dehalococcoidia bacterium]|nr:hypothetical protein [Dehalococcoidia bacterium]
MTTNEPTRAELAFQAIAAVECPGCSEAIHLDVSRKGEDERCESCGERYCLACGELEGGDCDCIPRCGDCGTWIELPPPERVQALVECRACGMYLCNLCGAVTFCDTHDLNTEERWAEGGDHAFLADPPVLAAEPLADVSKKAMLDFFGDLAPIANTYGGMFAGEPGGYSYASAIFEVAGVFVIQAEWSSAPGVWGTHYLAENPDE